MGARPGILAEVTNRLEVDRINIKSVITSQTSINILLATSDLEKANENFKNIPLKTVKNIRTEKNISVIAVVGDGITMQAGVMSKILVALASDSINIKTIVMGASPVSAYLVVEKTYKVVAIRNIHKELFETNNKIKQQEYEITTSF